jgi:hypothetical protein
MLGDDGAPSHQRGAFARTIGSFRGMMQGIAGSFRSSPSATLRDEVAPGAPITRRSASLASPVRPPPPGSLPIHRADAAARRWGMVRGAVEELGHAERHPGIHEEVQRQREARLRGLLGRGRFEGARFADVVGQLRPGGLARRADDALARRSVWQARPQAPVSLEQLGRSPGVGTRVLDVLRVPSRKNLRNLWGGSPPPFPRTNWTSLVPPLVLSGHVASLTSRWP